MKALSSSSQVPVSTCSSTARKPKSSLDLQRFAFLIAFFVPWTAVSGSAEGRFRLTSQSGFSATSNIDELSEPNIREKVFLYSPSWRVSRVSALSNGDALNYVNLNEPPYKNSVRRSIESKEPSVLNLTETTIHFTRNWKNGDGIVDLLSGDTENPEGSDFTSLNKKHKGLAKFMKARVSAQTNILSVNENFERNVAPGTGRRRLSFLKDLKGFTKGSLKTTTPKIVSSSPNVKSLPEELEISGSTTEAIAKPSSLKSENVPANSGVYIKDDRLSMIRKLKLSTALPQNEISDTIYLRSREEQDSLTVKPKDGLPPAMRNYLKDRVQSRRITLRVGSLANDSIVAPDNSNSNADDLSVRSFFFVPDNETVPTTSISTEILTPENTIASITTTEIVKIERIGDIEKGSTGQILLQDTTLSPLLKESDKTVFKTNFPLESTESASTTTVATTTSRDFIIHKPETREQPETTISTQRHTKSLPQTESLKFSTFLPNEIASTTEKSELQIFTTKFTEKTLSDIQTIPYVLKRSSVKTTTDFQLITDDQDWNEHSTITAEPPHVGPRVEREPVISHADTAGITVCLVILCIGLLLLVLGIYLICQNSKPRDSSNNVEPYSARRFSDV